MRAAVPALRPPVPRVADELVALRSWLASDAPQLARVLCDPEVQRWTTTPQPYCERDAVEWIATHPGPVAGRSLAPLAILDAGTERLVGSVELFVRDWHERVGEVGFAVAADDRGRGTATRAVRLVSRWGLLDVGLGRVELLSDPANAASQRVAAKAGFTREGLLRSAQAIRGQRVDLVFFSLIRGDVA